MRTMKKLLSFVLAAVTVLTVFTVGAVPTTLKAEAAGWNGYNYGGGTPSGYQTILEAYGIKYDVYMKWLDDHDKDSPNPDYYLGTPYVGQDHRNPHGDCQGAYGAYDIPGHEGMNCTGFVWHVLYKAAVHSGASRSQINRLGVMGSVLSSWYSNGVYRIWFNNLEDAYNSGVLEKGDVMWIYGSSDNHNAIFYGDSPKDFMYWDSAGERNRYCEVHSIGKCLGLWVCKVTQPKKIELQIDTAPGGSGTKFGTKYCIFDSKADAQAALDDPDNAAAWDKREGTIVLDSKGHGCLREQSAPAAAELWDNGNPVTNHSYFNTNGRKVNAASTYYAVQWSAAPGISEDKEIHEFKDSGSRTPSGYRIFRAYAPIKVDTPEMTEIKSVSDGISMKWNAVKDAQKYRIYYRSRTGEWKRMAETASTSYIDKDVEPGDTFTYTLRCVDKYGNFISGFNSAGWKGTYTAVGTPKITSIENTAEGLVINWDEVNNPYEGTEIRYRVYYKNSKGGWTRMTETEGTTYTDYAVAKGTTYTYTVRCVDAFGDFVSKYNTTGWKGTFEGTDTPKITELISKPEGILIKWDAIDSVGIYRVYCRKADGSWARIGEIGDTEFLDDVVTAGNSYTYTVRCVNSKGYFISDFNKTGWKATYNGVDTPAISEINSEPGGIGMAWAPVEGAVKYRVYRMNSSGGWQRIADVTDSSYLDDDVTRNKEYRYTVRCVNNNGSFMSGYDKNGSKCVYQGTETPQISALENTAEGVKISWDAVDGAVSYRVFYYRDNGWIRLATTDGTSYVDVSAKSGEEYTYTVRCVGKNDNYISDYDHEGSKIEYIPPEEA